MDEFGDLDSNQGFKFIDFNPNLYRDVKDKYSSVEVKVKSPRASILFDPANIVFVCLPQIEEKTGKMFIPGIQPNGAWVHVFDRIELKTGSGVLFF